MNSNSNLFKARIRFANNKLYLLKAKKAEVGEIRVGKSGIKRKKVAEGKWEIVKEDKGKKPEEKNGIKKKVDDKTKVSKKKMVDALKTTIKGFIEAITNTLAGGGGVETLAQTTRQAGQEIKGAREPKPVQSTNSFAKPPKKKVS